jgi:hypothetical protein
MLIAIIWWGGILLESVLLFRGFRSRILSTYPFFYIYSASILVMAVVLTIPSMYAKWFWQTQFLTLVIGYGILLEILRHVLSPYPGAERFARIAGVVAFGVIFCLAVVYPFMTSDWSPAGTIVELERDLRTVQAIFLFGLLGVISYYRIAIGKNMKGMIFGYGLYVGTSLISLAMRSYASPARSVHWIIVQPLSYDISLLVWLSTLWSYHRNPIPDRTIQLEADYEDFAARTRSTMGAIRSYLVRVARS